MLARTALPFTLIALAACGGTDAESITADPPPPVTFTTAALTTTQDRLEDTLNYPRNQTVAITGTADFIGGFAADLSVNGEDGQQLVGNIDMSMNFNTDQVVGQMRNMGIANQANQSTEGVLGVVTLTGTVGPVAASTKPSDLPGSSGANSGIAQNILLAGGPGILTGNFGEPTTGNVAVDVDLVAHARDRPGDTRDWFSGVISGNGTGDHDLDFQGRFYLFEDP